MPRSAPMVNQADDRLDTQLAQTGEGDIGPRPISVLQLTWGDVLPQDRVSDRSDAKRREAVEIVEAVTMPAQLDLIQITIADPVDRALQTAPKLKRLHRPRPSRDFGRRPESHCTASSLRRAVRGAISTAAGAISVVASLINRRIWVTTLSHDALFAFLTPSVIMTRSGLLAARAARLTNSSRER